MAEATNSRAVMHNLGRGGGKGPKLWAGLIEVSDGETLDMGLDVIDGAGSIGQGAPDGAGNAWVTIESVSVGIITFGTGQKTTPATTVSDADIYILVAGWVR